MHCSCSIAFIHSHLAVPHLQAPSPTPLTRTETKCVHTTTAEWSTPIWTQCSTSTQTSSFTAHRYTACNMHLPQLFPQFYSDRIYVLAPSSDELTSFTLSHLLPRILPLPASLPASHPPSPFFPHPFSLPPSPFLPHPASLPRSPFIPSPFLPLPAFLEPLTHGSRPHRA